MRVIRLETGEEHSSSTWRKRWEASADLQRDPNDTKHSEESCRIHLVFLVLMNQSETEKEVTHIMKKQITKEKEHTG